MLDGNPVVSDWGYTSFLSKNHISGFMNSSQYWGARYWKLLTNNAFWRISNYVVRNADFVEDIGANYTTTTWYNHPYNYKDTKGK